MSDTASHLAFLSQIDDHRERYCLTKSGNNTQSAKSCILGGHTYTISLKEELKPECDSNLTKIFTSVYQDLSSRRSEKDYEPDQVIAAWKKLKQKYSAAKRKHIETTNSFTRIFIKLWSWITRTPTLQTSFHSLSNLLIDMCKEKVIGTNNSENTVALEGMLYCLTDRKDPDRLFYGHALRFIAKEIDPVLMLHTLTGALTRVFTKKQAHADEEEKYILDALEITIGRLQGKQKNELKKIDPITPMLFAIEYNHLPLAKQLLTSLLALDIDAKDLILGNYLLSAASRGNMEMFRLFLRKNTHLHIVDKKKGMTALHLAVKNGHGDFARILLKMGANRNALDDSKKTPAEYANTPELIALFSS